MQNKFFQRGTTVVGFLLGLIVGLGVAVAVAVFVTKAPIPFVNKATKHSDRLEPKAGAELPDPNKTMQSKAGKPPAASAESSGEAKPEEKKDSILGLLGTIGGAVGDKPAEKSAESAKTDAPKSAPAATTPAAPVVPPSAPVIKPPETKTEAKGEIKAEEPKQSGFFLQVGSFQSAQDAENRKARLALAGFEAKVMSAEVDGKTVHRVRTGPYKTFDEMTKARGEITQNGFDVSVARQ